MKLTELKNKIDEALKYQSDYDVVVDGLELYHTHIDDCGITSDKRNFYIGIDEYD